MMTDAVRTSRVAEPGSFDAQDHFYPQVLNAQIHPLVRYFMDLGNERIAERYCHLHPEVDPASVRELLSGRTRWFRWGGADLFHTANERGGRDIVVIETNSCPSGQKSMPLIHEREEAAGYRVLLERSFVPALKRRGLPPGELAVLWDKNPMETSGYAAVLAELTGEPVHLVPCFDGSSHETVRWDDGLLHIRAEDGTWRPIRAAFRYVTQRPWNRIPALTRTMVYNPVLICLAGGRNKLLAAKAYDVFNAEAESSGVRIRVPETIWDVSREEVPMWVARMGGIAVVKNPYSNAGQGVWTITNPAELEAFMELDHTYDRFIVQALVGNAGWSSRSRGGRLYHVGTVPDRRGEIYVADVRFMVGVGPDGFFPVAVYARRARRPLKADPPAGAESWSILGTNLSVATGDGQWTTESNRLMLMDSRDFNRLGLGLDDLVDGYLQTVFAMKAIDRMAGELVTQKGRFRRRLFGSVTPDAALSAEIMA